ncbi:MAG: GntR family transcriptional regulator [Bacilli bacterium]|nr:GntR family transcriptional regulator [Bacilli bacterium]
MGEIFFDNNIPIYIQLVDYFKIYIISGKMKPGERISSVRELAIYFKVNPNTMQKALTELENLKLIYTERTNGKFVTKDEKLIKKLKDDYAKTLIEKFYNEMTALSLNKKEIINYINEIGDDE